MVDVSEKIGNKRTAKAYARMSLAKSLKAIDKVGNTAKGNIFETARLAGIMAAKKTPHLIPLCHVIPVDDVSVVFNITTEFVEIVSTVKSFSRTGVEMEALTAVTAAALTVYDMCKSADKNIMIEKICLLEKTGGKSGTWKRESKK
jgi:cyclic pyranopterin phosphate synthase